MKKLLLFSALLCGILASAGTIRTPQTKDRAIAFAASDMARCLSIVSGKKYSTAVEGKAVAGDIVLKFAPGLADQEWHLKTVNGVLYISGSSAPGIVYGVYTFLEKYANCLWPAPDTEVIPANPKWKIPAVDEKNKPAISRREMYVGYDYMDSDWRLRNKENFRASHNVNISVGSPREHHTFGIYIRPVREAAKKDPSLFGKNIQGATCHTLCMTNPKVQEIVAAEMEKYILADRKKYAKVPEYARPRIYDLSQLDGGSGFECWCQGCSTLAKSEGSYSGANIHFVNAVARKIGKKFPDVIIRTFAYSFTSKPPKTIKAEPNVVVQFCKAGISNPLLKGTVNGDDLEKWGKHAAKKSIWSYWRIYSGNLYPFARPLKDIAGEIRFCRDNGVIHYFAENEAPLSRSFAMLQHWLMLKMCENPDQDINALAATFMKHYYGAAAPVMMKYLEYMTDVQQENRSHLNRSFFEKVNAWLDEAEKLVAKDKRSLLHVTWERTVVDRTMYHHLAELLKEGYKTDFKKVAARFAAGNKAVINHWSGLKAKLKKQRLENAVQEGELYKYFPVTIPERFEGCDVVDMHWTQIGTDSETNVIKDPDAICGMAFYNKTYEYKPVFSLGFYNGAIRQGSGLTFGPGEAEIPQDEKFHLYRLGKAIIQKPLYVHWDNTWECRSYLNVIGIIPHAREIWVSMKFTGPMYVKNSKQPNRVLFDRMLLVKDPNPFRHYEKVDFTRNLAKNGGVEKFSAKWIDDFGRPTSKMNVDTKVKRSGKASIRVGNTAKSYGYAAIPLGKIANIKGDLLIRGWFKCENLMNTEGYKLPFLGIWTSTAKYRNSYVKPLVTFYPNSRDWQYFEEIVEMDEIREKMKNLPTARRPHTMAFRLNLANQPGTVWLDDIEIIPLKKKGAK